MIRHQSEAEQAFRREIRAWLEDNLAPGLRHLTFRPEPAIIMEWYATLSQRGIVAPHWPKAAGGMGATPVEQVILMEELTRIGAPDIPTQGLNHIGPLLIAKGTPEQKARHLPPILEGRAIWCQGYSEPGAGSDLTALRTKARVEGDELVLDGQKIWTTWGHHAHWMFALVRTGGERRQGITFVLIDMTSPGLTRRAIRTIAGDDEFAEVFFDGVRVPRENIVGEIGDGWAVATALLDEERLNIGSPLHANRAYVRLAALVRRMQPDRAATWADALTRARIGVETVTASYLDAKERFEAGGGVGSESAYLKILATETTQAILDRAVEAAGELGACVEPLIDNGERLDLNEMYLQSRRLSIYGGSNEIMRTLLASRVLGMGRRARA